MSDLDRLESVGRELRKYVGSRVSSEDDAQDIVQNVLLESLKEYEIPARRWFFERADWRIRDYWRKRRRDPHVFCEANEDEPGIEASHDSVADVLKPVTGLVRIVPELRFTPAESSCLEEVLEFDKSGEILDFLSAHDSLFPKATVDPRTPQAKRKARSRARGKASRLMVLASCLSGNLPPDDFVRYAFKTNPHLRGGSFEPILKRAHLLRNNPDFYRPMLPYLERLTEASFRCLHTSHFKPADRSRDFVCGYSGLRMTTLLNPGLVEDALRDFRSMFSSAALTDPLLGAALQRMEGLTGNLEAVERTRLRWRRAVQEEIMWEACYVAMYFSPPALESELLRRLASGNIRSARKYLRDNSGRIRKAVLKEARANLDEQWYVENPDWAASNYYRLKLVLKTTVGGCRDLSPSDVRTFQAVGRNAIELNRDCRFKEDVWGTLRGYHSF